jgi:uncharacterized membrane protein YhiD involved in acid resistance
MNILTARDLASMFSLDLGADAATLICLAAAFVLGCLIGVERQPR